MKVYNYQLYIDALEKHVPEKVESMQALAREIVEKENLPLGADLFRKYISAYLKDRDSGQLPVTEAAEQKEESKIFQSGQTVDANDLEEDDRINILQDDYERKFLVTQDGRYIIEVRGKRRYFSIKFIDKLFLHYSEHGYNFSGTQIINEFDLDPATFHAIKNSFRLYKKSHIFSPYTFGNTPKEQREQLVSQTIDKVLSSGKVTERVYRKQLHSKYKQAIKRDHTIKANHLEFIEELAERLPEAKAETIVQYTAPNIILQREEVIAALTDLHTGAFVMGLDGMPDFNLSVLKKRLLEAAYFINSLRAKRVKLALLGDYIESFTGMNHPNSWQGIQSGQIGADVVETAYELILSFAEQIVNLVEIDGVGGNHDRSSKSNKEDTKAEIAGILFCFIKRHFRNTPIEVKYNNDTVSTTLGSSLNAILQHGHNGNARGPVGNTLWEHGIKGRFNFILQGHLHSRQVKPNDDGADYRRIVCPSIFTGNDYSKKAGYSPSLAGVIAIEEDNRKLPYVHDKALI